jgi:hypothetical protein
LAEIYHYKGTAFPHVYPPFVSTILFFPFTLLQYPTALNLWFWCSILFLYGSFALLFLLVKQVSSVRGQEAFSPDAFLLLSFAAFLIFFYPFSENFRWAQINLLILVVLILFLYFLLNDKAILAGLCLSVIILIKIAPVLFWLYLLFKRKYRMALFTLIFLTVLSFASVAIMGTDHVRFYIEKVLPTLSFGKAVYGAPDMIAGYYGNYSLNSFFSSLFVESVLGNQIPWRNPALGKLLYYAVSFILLGDTLVRSTREQKAESKPYALLQLSHIVILYSLISSITFEHHLVSLCIPLTVIGLQFVHKKPTRLWIAFYVISWVVLSLNVEKIYFQPAFSFYMKHIAFSANRAVLSYLFLLALPMKMYAMILLWACGRKAERSLALEKQNEENKNGRPCSSCSS